MANQNKIANWILQHKNNVKPIFTQYDWPERYFNQVFDFELAITIGNIESYGRGIDQNSNLAVEKAAAEALERWICINLKIPSVGVALSGENSSVEHASNEALERYYLFEHIRIMQPFSKISQTTINKSKVLSLIIAHFKVRNNLTDISFYKMATPICTNGVICTINTYNNKTICGFSLSESLEKSLIKSFYEALPNYAATQDLNPNLQISQKVTKQSNELTWHLDSEFLNKLNPLLDNSDEETNSFSFVKPEIKISRISISQFQELIGCPIDPVRAEITSGAL